MKQRIAVPLILCVSALASVQSADAQQRPVDAERSPTGVLVSPAWLAGHLSDPNLVVFHIGTDSEYNAAHIPGARFVKYRSYTAPTDSIAMAMMMDPARRNLPHALSTELPAPARLDSLFAAEGVTAKSIVVITFEDWATPAARALLTMEYAGLRGRAFLFDRSVSTWKKEGHPVSTTTPKAVVGNYHTVPHTAEVIVDAAWLAPRLKSPGVVIIDARDPEFYDGTAQNDMMPRKGHIPGARSIPFGTLIDSAGRLLPDAEVRAKFVAAGISPGDTVISYCHIGQQGSLVYALARELGYTVRLYDGSFEDWSMRSELPVESGK